jgi:hypothetical protein
LLIIAGLLSFCGGGTTAALEAASFPGEGLRMLYLVVFVLNLKFWLVLVKEAYYVLEFVREAVAIPYKRVGVLSA